MKRIVLLAAACAATVGAAAPVSARASTPNPAQYASTTNDIVSRIPGFSGGDTRHICLISDGMNRSWCIYVPLP
jgi:hypothetical protein